MYCFCACNGENYYSEMWPLIVLCNRTVASSSEEIKWRCRSVYSALRILQLFYTIGVIVKG